MGAAGYGGGDAPGASCRRVTSTSPGASSSSSSARRLGQVHAVAAPRRPRSPERGDGHSRARISALRRSALACSGSDARLHLPAVQPGPTLTALENVEPAIAPMGPGARAHRGRRSCSSPVGLGPRSDPPLASFPVASSSGSRSRVRWRTSRACCLPMSPRATSTRHRRGDLALLLQAQRRDRRDHRPDHPRPGDRTAAPRVLRWPRSIVFQTAPRTAELPDARAGSTPMIRARRRRAPLAVPIAAAVLAVSVAGCGGGEARRVPPARAPTPSSSRTASSSMASRCRAAEA